jgi:NADH:ubiquinone oxidoreductase subunit 6 (subunit J)
MGLASYKPDLKWGVAVLLFAVLALSGALFASWGCPVGDVGRSGAIACSGNPEPGTEDLGALTGSLLAPTGLVLVLELLGVVLVAALIGALVMAIREKEGAA